MPTLNTPRAGRDKDGYMEKLIANMYTDQKVFYRQGYGICDYNLNTIIHSFNSVRNTYCNIHPVRVHYMEIYVESKYGKDAVNSMADLIGTSLWKQGFQSFICIADMKDGYLVAVAINATSFRDGKAFHDNNLHYAQIYTMLQNQLPGFWKLDVADNIFFDPKEGTGNYKHGYFA